MFLVVAGCKLSITKVRYPLVVWECEERYEPPPKPGSGIITGTCQASSDAVENNNGVLTVQGIQESENSATVDIFFSNLRYKDRGSEGKYSGPGTASFLKYNDGFWTLKKVSIPNKTWDEINIKTL
jgi:hypothetical protein